MPLIIMRWNHKLAFLLTLSLLLTVLRSARAQLVNDTATNTLGAVTNLVPGDVVVGTNGPFTTLILTNAAAVLNTNGTIGLNAGSDSNLVYVTGTNTVWSNAATLVVGDASSFNQLVVSNGGRVVAANLTVSDTVGSSNNVLQLGGTNTVLRISGALNFGTNGVGNQLIITNGALLQSGTAIVGAGAAGDNNLVQVAGLGAMWTNAGNLTFGQAGSGNTMVVSNGAAFFSSGSATIGNGAGAANGRVWVTGPNSVWSNRGSLTVGNAGAGNQFIVSNAGLAIATNLSIGVALGADNNRVMVSGTNSLLRVINNSIIGIEGSSSLLIVTNGGAFVSSNLVTVGGGGGLGSVLGIGPGTATITNAAGTAMLDVQNGSAFLRGGALILDQLLLTSANGALVLDAGTLVTRGGIVSNGADLVLSGIDSLAPVTWDIRAGSNMVLAQTMTLGNGSVGGNTLLITNGGSLIAAGSFATLGGTPEATNNLAVIAGSNSTWRLDTLTLGLSSTGNRVVVSNSGRLVSSTVSVGVYAPSNTLEIVGTNTVWTNSADVFIGSENPYNTLIISNGARADTLNATIGRNFGSPNNLVIITGTGTRWNVTNELKVGDGGDLNRLILSNGAFLAGSNTYVGRASQANAMLVQDPGTFATNRGDLRIGEAGGYNLLVISNGARVAGLNGSLGFSNGALFNVAIVDGAGSAWSNRGTLLIGRAGNDNTLLITNGALVQAATTTLGSVAGGSNNTLAVNGPASILTNSGTLTVGGAALSNRLSILNGGTVYSSNAVMGLNGGAFANATIISGANSVWTNTSVTNASIIGSSGRANTLQLDTAGRFFASALIIGNAPGSINNLVSVTDAGSVLVATNSLELSLADIGSRLLISNGGAVLTATGRIGGLTTNFTNLGGLALVNGPGSIWSNAVSLTVGDSGVSNILIVSNGASVIARSNLIIGAQLTSSNNIVAIVGSTLIVSNTNASGTLDHRNGLLTLTGGTITADRLLMTNAAGVSNQGANFAFDSGTLNVGFAMVSNGAPFIVGTSTNAAVLNFTGSSNRTFANGLQISSNTLLSFAAGTLNSSATTNLNGQVFVVGNGVSPATFNLTGNGTHSLTNGLLVNTNSSLLGNGSILGSVTNFGAFRPGASAGAVSITGGLSLKATASMTFEIGGLIATNQYDRVNVSSLVEFVGSLSLALINGWLPGSNDTYTIMTFGSATGTFANATNNARLSVSNGLASFKVTYTATNLVLAQPIVSTLDSDGDGQTDLAELMAGTSTNNSRDFLTFTSVTFPGGTNVVLQWQSVTNISYRLLFSTNLASGWTTITGAVFTTPATNRTQWIDNGTLTPPLTNATQRHYRVGVQ